MVLNVLACQECGQAFWCISRTATGSLGVDRSSCNRVQVAQLCGSFAAENQVCDEPEDRKGERDHEPEGSPHPAKAGVLMYPQGDKEKRDVQAQ